MQETKTKAYSTHIVQQEQFDIKQGRYSTEKNEPLDQSEVTKAKPQSESKSPLKKTLECK